ncbi:catalase-like domain-containing protein [Trichophaea hybrida]|nr:catalase-like domain-containing protein [Trichophaea hybrida]
MSAAGADPRLMQKASTFMYANDGPAVVAAKITGVIDGGKRKDDAPYFTNNEGISWPDAVHSKNVGGIPLVSDTFLLQKQQTFNRSKTLDRMVHPAGSGAFGYFEATHDMSHLTKAGKRTPVFVRFSTVTFGREFPDSGRNRGFTIKHYTEEGNYDVAGLNWSIFFCRDPIQGPRAGMISRGQKQSRCLVKIRTLRSATSDYVGGSGKFLGVEDSPDPLLQFRMFFYCDTQYHRLGVNPTKYLVNNSNHLQHRSQSSGTKGSEWELRHLAGSPGGGVNCQFMANSYYSINFDGPLCSDANTGGNPHYVPNSFVNKFRPDCASTPYAVEDNIVSRQSHSYSEDTPEEIERICITIPPSVHYPIIQENYLAQVYNIEPGYARKVYDLLPEKEFEFEVVKEKAKEAMFKGKEKKFRPVAKNGEMWGRSGNDDV